MNSKPFPNSKVFFGEKLTGRHLVTLRRTFWPTVLLALVAAGVAAARFEATSQVGPEPEDGSALPVESLVLSQVTGYTQSRTYTGVVKAARSSDLSFKRSDRLVQVLVDRGDRVEQGQSLAQLDTRRLESKHQQIEAQLDQARAILDELVAGPRQETIAAQNATVRDMAARVSLLEAQLNRRQRLLQDSAVSKEFFEQAAFGLDSERARLDAAQRNLDELNAGTRKEQLAAQRAAVKQLEASLRDVQIEIEDSRLVAPFHGFITKRYVDEGTIVSPAQPLIHIVEQEPLEAWIGLSPSAAQRLSVGGRHEVEVRGKRYPANVRSVTAELDLTTRTRTVVLTLNDVTATDIVPGEVARIVVDEETDSAGFWAPTTALARGSHGLWSVYAVEANDDGHQIVQRRDVEMIYSDGVRALIRGTVAEGDRIVASGVHRLVAGQRVTPQSPSANQQETL